MDGTLIVLDGVMRNFQGKKIASKVGISPGNTLEFKEEKWSNYGDLTGI